MSWLGNGRACIVYHNNIFKKFRNITICKSVAVSQGGSLRRLQSRNIPLATDFLIQQRASYPARIMSRPPFQQENQSNNNAEDEESKLLASLGSAVQNMDSYEQDVLKTAELESAPKLEGIGFPTSLKGNLSQVPAMQQILQNVRTQLQQSPHNLALLLKQQIILNMLHTATNDADLCVRPQEEFRQEQERRHRFQRQMNSSNAATQQQQHPSLHATIARKPKVQKKDPPKSVLKTKPSAGLKRSHDDGDGDASPRTAGERLEEIKHGKGVRFAQDVINQKRRRRRIGIQPRKIKSGGNEIDEEEGKDIQKRKKYLKKLRKQRELRRRKIKQKSSNTDDDNDSDGEEHEFIDEDNVASVKTEEHPSDNTGDTTSMQSFTTSQPSPDTNPRQNDEEPTKDMSVTVLCPLCWEDVHVETPVESDRILSEHMNICQSAKTRGQRRSTRTKTTVRYTENDDDNAMFHDTISAPQNQSAAIFIKKVDPCDIGSQLQMATMPINTHDDDDEAFEAKKLIDDDDEMLEVDAAMDENDEEVIAPNNKKRPASFTPSPRPVALDDWDEDDYEDRVDDWIETGVQSMRVMKEQDKTETPPGEHIYDGGLIIPAWVNDRLFPYQRTALQWMWELHRQQAGGIIGDEMGLGKTVQICAFLGSMASSRKLKSILIISPATMLQHWLQEMAKWAPGVRRILIHQSADTDRRSRSISAPMLSAVNQWLKECRHSRLFEAIDEDDLETRPPHSFPGTAFAFVTTYENVRRNPDIWIHHNWSYVVMDEAQKIRNPDADITLVCKRLRTPHRLALSGTPIQNDLRELWSIFDFVFPGRLGTLPAFEQEFADPIKRGGYSNAPPMQVQLAYRCALLLRDLINPYLLRRLKKDIKEVNRMPGKKEQVLFCRLSGRQRSMYEAFLQSDLVKRIVKRNSTQLLGAITMIRKICNHPDLVCPPDSLDAFLQKGFVGDSDFADAYSDDGDESSVGEEESLTERSGKLEVLAKILPLWHEQGHRVLIFCQWKKMLNIIQRFVELKGWKFGRLDGNTNVASRQRLVDKFNSDDSYFGMLCTTRTGGVGLNLTGADRIILYDPDWNPQTDAQARERAWRFGQEREVTVYRLIVAGTVEEKIYQRQIFKTALSNRVLQDPRQRRLFSQKDLKDLFTLKADSGSVVSGGDGFTETTQLTKGDGYVDPDEENEASGDNEETMQTVLKSKGLAGVFDHDVVESNGTAKKSSVREMEAKAKQIAKNALSALEESVSGHDSFAPTWTGSAETQIRRFGDNRNGGALSSIIGSRSPSAGIGTGTPAASSNVLLASIRERDDEIKALGKPNQRNDTKQYTELLKRIRDFVRQQVPTTDALLDAFESVPNYDAAVFRRLLRSVATIDKSVGRWRLKVAEPPIGSSNVSLTADH